MKCYYHREIDAIATCKNCGKGLCAQCAAEVGKSIACKSSCIAEVQAMNSILQQTMKSFETNRRVYSQIALWMAVTGVGFLISSFFLSRTAGFQIFVGIVMLLGALFMYAASQRYKA